MNIQKYVEELNDIHCCILEYIDEQGNEEENYQKLISLFESQNTKKLKNEPKLILRLLNKIAQNHHRGQDFFSKIEKIINYFLDEIKKYSNDEIFNIFKNNKHMVLYLFEEKIIFIDDYIFSQLTSKEFKLRNYHLYFKPEIDEYMESFHDYILDELRNLSKKEKSEKEEEEEELKIDDKTREDDPKYEVWSEYYFTEDDESNSNEENEEIDDSNINDRKETNTTDEFNQKRKKGENSNSLCQIIQQDLIEEFIVYVKKGSLSLNNIVEKSIFETNSFLLKNNKTTLIEYAAFMGAAQIVKYLFLNGAKVKSSIWLYAVHGDDAEIIRFLEENCSSKLLNNNSLILDTLLESIKCHHNDITNYIQCQYIDAKFSNFYCKPVLECLLHYYNTPYFQDYIKKRIFFHYACEFDYYNLVKIFIKTKKIDLNEIVISYFYFI